MCQQYCSKCIMKAGNPSIQIDENGLCNLCNGSHSKKTLYSFKSALRNYTEFKNYLKNNNKSGYKFMFMLSGGKDSTFMLYKLVTEDKQKPLVLTINHPFESKSAMRNVQNAIEMLDVDHILFTQKIGAYKKLMKSIFTKNKEQINSKLDRLEKLPCMACTYFLKITSYLLAYKMQIPFILYCADPQQSASLEIDIHNIILAFYDLCGEDIANEVFDNDLYKILNEDVNNLPKFVFPYVALNDYDPSKIIATLKNLNMYESSIRETHCTMHSLLNYYAFKKFDCGLYTAEKAASVRQGQLDRGIAIKLMEDYKRIFTEIAVKDEISEDNRAFIKETLSQFYPGQHLTIEHEFNNILNLKSIVKELDIDIREI